jgi:hypothetical protein
MLVPSPSMTASATIGSQRQRASPLRKTKGPRGPWLEFMISYSYDIWVARGYSRSLQRKVLV